MRKLCQVCESAVQAACKCGSHAKSVRVQYRSLAQCGSYAKFVRVQYRSLAKFVRVQYRSLAQFLRVQYRSLAQCGSYANFVRVRSRALFRCKLCWAVGCGGAGLRLQKVTLASVGHRSPATSGRQQPRVAAGKPLACDLLFFCEK
eukprot:309592-Chlamydomonas_euryale.AAC.1